MIEHVTDVQVLRPARAMLLTVCQGRVWLTRAGDAADHVLSAGDRLAVAAGDCLYVEPWRRGEAARLHWQAMPRPMPAPPIALRVLLAAGLRGLAGGVLALARRVEARSPAGAPARPPACPVA